ncbi:small basic family protein [Clostridium sediminicola]|uniref:small basic family protein n=1 Tax=Clostridium sediminicola TaxID=3114879 RepID=UPI0031F2105D
MIIFIGLIIGILVGMFSNIAIPSQFDAYLSVAILACLDSVFGALKAVMEKKFRTDVFISGFFGNAILAALLTYLGDKLEMPVYIAAIIVFGSRIFNNFSLIRRMLLDKLEESRLH